MVSPFLFFLFLVRLACAVAFLMRVSSYYVTQTRFNVTLFDKDNVAVASAKPSDRATVTGTIIEYDVQKNRENKQKLGYDRCTNLDRKRYDLTENMMQIIDRADQLGQPHHLPLTVFKDTAGKVKYLTGQVYTEFVR